MATPIVHEPRPARNPIYAVLTNPPPAPCPVCAAPVGYDGLRHLTCPCGWAHTLTRREADDWFFALLDLSDVTPALFLAALQGA